MKRLQISTAEGGAQGETKYHGRKPVRLLFIDLVVRADVQKFDDVIGNPIHKTDIASDRT